MGILGLLKKGSKKVQYKIRWTRRDGVDEYRIIHDYSEAVKLQNYLIKKNALNVDMAVILSSTYDLQNNKFRKVP